MSNPKLFVCPECSCRFEAPLGTLGACPTCDWWECGDPDEHAQECECGDCKQPQPVLDEATSRKP